MRRALRIGILLAAIAVGAAFAFVPALVERALNPVRRDPSLRPSPRALALHRTLRIVDLHADSLLWERDLLARSRRGQVDLPRLVEGGVALQVFTVVTQAPRGQNLERNEATSDLVTPLVVLQLRPPSTWSSRLARVLDQAARLHAFARRSDGRLEVVGTRAQLERFLRDREVDPGRVAALLGVEGAHALEGELANLERMFDAGVRMVAPTHFFDTELAGSAHGVTKGGLTALGEAWLRAMEERRMLVDLAHASPRTIEDVLARATRPVVVSHTGVRGTCDNARNLGDEQLRAIARIGGLVGIGYWETAVCATDPGAVARAVRHAVRVAGVAHVALGSDFDGTIEAPFDTSELALLTDALLTEGLSEEEVRAVMGENALRLLASALP